MARPTIRQRTGQREADILDAPVDVAIVLERDQDGDDFFEQKIPLLLGTG